MLSIDPFGLELSFVIPFSSKYKLNQILKINIAHNEGNYFTDPKHLTELNKENLIAFKYCDENFELLFITFIFTSLLINFRFLFLSKVPFSNPVSVKI